MVISGYVTKMAVTPFNPPYLKIPYYIQMVPFYRSGVMADQTFVRICIFKLFLLLWPRPWPDDIIYELDPYSLDILDVWKLPSYVKSVESYHNAACVAEMRGYHFLISVSYPYPWLIIRILSVSIQKLKINIRILSVSVWEWIDCPCSAPSVAAINCHWGDR